MRVLWLCNIMLPAIARELGLPYSNREGWLTGIYERICHAKERLGREGEGERFPKGQNGAGIELGICFPIDGIPIDGRTAEARKRRRVSGWKGAAFVVTVLRKTWQRRKYMMTVWKGG